MATDLATTRSKQNGHGIPFSDDAEQALLACLMIDPSRIVEAEKIVGVEDFFIKPHQIIFRHIIAADALGRSADVVLLKRQLDDDGDLERVGGMSYLVELAAAAPTASNAIYYAEQICDKSRRRQAMVAYGTAAEKIQAGTDPSDVQAWLHDELAFNTTGKASIVPVCELIEQNPKMREPVIEGLLRRGETGNIIAASKVGKSWLVYALALCIVVGARWLDTFQCRAGRVLIIDNELHREVLAHRIPVVADALGIRSSEYRDRLDVITLRGESVDLYGVARLLNRVRPNTYDLVIGDAFYRFIPKDTSENDNAQIMALYNTIDAMAARQGCAWVNIHHASKGSQGAKAVTDVGSGAGAQSRAADTHLVLRPHEDDGIVELDAAVRSFPPIEPLALRWTFPVWQPEEDVDTTKLKGNQTKGEQRQQDNDKEGFTKILDAIAEHGPATQSALNRTTGISIGRLKRLSGMLESESHIIGKATKINGCPSPEFELTDPSFGGCAT